MTVTCAVQAAFERAGLPSFGLRRLRNGSSLCCPRKWIRSSTGSTFTQRASRPRWAGTSGTRRCHVGLWPPLSMRAPGASSTSAAEPRSWSIACWSWVCSAWPSWTSPRPDSAIARRRLGAVADRVEWIVGDVTALETVGEFDVWHDRAVFHFLIDPMSRHRYVALSERTVRPGGTAVMATFAPDGPERCSGLPVHRFGEGDIARECGDGWHPIASERHVHLTPAGIEQRYLYATFRRVGPAILTPTSRHMLGTYTGRGSARGPRRSRACSPCRRRRSPCPRGGCAGPSRWRPRSGRSCRRRVDGGGLGKLGAHGCSSFVIRRGCAPGASGVGRRVGAVRPRSRRRSSWALAATMIVERLMATAPSAIGRSMPQGTRRPAATGMATTL